MYQTDLKIIAKHAEEREDENYRFRSWLKMKDAKPLDRVVHEINDRVSKAIDCTKCANCCKALVVSVTGQDMISCAKHLGMSKTEFTEKYIEKSEEGDFVINRMPCHFLADNKCTVYSHRFKDCRDFPYLQKPGFQGRLLGVIMNYGTCPIVYNVLEELKVRLRFR